MVDRPIKIVRSLRGTLFLLNSMAITTVQKRQTKKGSSEIISLNIRAIFVYSKL
jgi:hypothetical protein